jgi:glycosyltransferase involved in cell wall biosynthesis
LTGTPAPAAERAPAARALFINSGILGHRAVAGLLRETVGLMRSVDATHIDLSRDLTVGDRIIRRLFSIPLTPRTGVAGNLDLRRWRQELNVGLLARRRMAAAEQHGAFDLLHFHTQATAYASVARMRRTPSIVSIDATQHLASREAESSLARLSYQPNILHDGLVFSEARAIVATSEWAARDLVAHRPDCADKVNVMPYPVRACLDAAWIRERFTRAGTQTDRNVRVLFMGGDFPRKGGPDLLDAWREGGFRDRATLDLVTDWPLSGSQMPPGVRHIRGIVPNTPQWLDLWRQADLFVMPTRHESFGMVFQEAAAAGLPVVATRINAIPEIVQGRHTGILVTPGDRRGLVEAMRTLIDSPDLRLRMGTAAFDRIRFQSAPARYASKLETIIRRLLEDHGLPRP